MNKIVKIEIRATLFNEYSKNQQNFWYQAGVFFIDKTVSKCLDQAKQSLGHNFRYKVTRKWNHIGEVVYRNSGY